MGFRAAAALLSNCNVSSLKLTVGIGVSLPDAMLVADFTPIVPRAVTNVY